MIDEVGFYLVEDFYWFNFLKLLSFIEWVNKRKLCVKDFVNIIWWFSKIEWLKFDIIKVFVLYSDRMKKFIEDFNKFYFFKMCLLGYDISSSFGKDNGGVIFLNLL